MLDLPLAYYAYSSLFNAVVNFIIAVFIFLNRKELPTARLLAGLCGLIALWSWFYFLWLLVTDDPIKAGSLERTCMIPVIFIPAVFLHFASSITRKLLSPALHVANYLVSGFISTTVYTPLFSPGVSQHLVFPYWLIPGPVFPLHLAHIVASSLIGLSIMAAAALESAGRRRQQLIWVFWACTIGLISGFTNYLSWYRVNFPPILNSLVSFYVLALAYGIFRYQLLDIRIVIRRSLIYSILVACITAIYLVVVLVAEKGFQGLFGYRSLIATVFVAFIIAVFFNPLRNRIQEFVDRALFKATPLELAAQRDRLLTEVRKGEQMKAVGTLAAGLAHEIKNPLASIKTFTEHIEGHYDDPAFREKFQRIVGGEVERINLIVQRLLDFAKPVPPKLIPIDVTRVLDETLELLQGKFMQRRVQVIRRYRAQVPVLGDPQQLKQAFLNFFLNSLDALDGSGRVHIQTGIRGSDMTVAITDNGPGIAPHDLPHVFDPFFTTKTSGTGLGLSVVQGIVKEHGGRLEVRSRPRGGTRIKLYLPIVLE